MYRHLLFVLLYVLWIDVSCSASLSISIEDQKGQKIENVVVELIPQFELKNAVRVEKEATMDQVDNQFVPHVLTIYKNTRVRFPNSDNIKHHVYSFSPAKSFEIKLYKSFEAKPILFDKPGIADIGCNIHDWMLGYIYVSDSPFFGTSNQDGFVEVNAPEGVYTVKIWHPRLDPDHPQEQPSIDLSKTSNLVLKLTHPLLPDYLYNDGFKDY